MFGFGKLKASQPELDQAAWGWGNKSSEVISRHTKDQEVIGHNQHGFVKGKSYSLVASYDETNGLVDKRMAVDLACLEFSKLSHIVSPKSSYTVWWGME